MLLHSSQKCREFLPANLSGHSYSWTSQQPCANQAMFSFFTISGRMEFGDVWQSVEVLLKCPVDPVGLPGS